MIDDFATQVVLQKRKLNKGIELLLGLVTGMLADGHLNDLEVKFLNAWLTEHDDVAAVWPGNMVAKLVSEMLADGTVTESEHARLIKMLTDLTGNNFAQTGSVTAEVITLPVDEQCPVSLRDANVCLTGEFLFGARAKCEEVASHAGATSYNTVTKKIAYLVIGTNVSPHWAHTSYGRKIEQAIELQQKGHPIKIISERRWLDAMS
ncbi:NAD-dependent DNA ligase [Polaromonas sp. CG_9.5]|uniref:BRCT domain-containing protein n=1 Tax=Polaromonas sp. CG_9.5 TaxID=3071705 RepID=UPI002E0A39D5|nr:NAD-dependent DNA ligase [Polaromonas sp. CG_9.5]